MNVHVVVACERSANNVLSTRVDGHELICVLITCERSANDVLGDVSTGIWKGERM